MSEDTKNSRKKDLYISSIEPSVSIRIGRTGIPVGSWQSTISMPVMFVKNVLFLLKPMGRAFRHRLRMR